MNSFWDIFSSNSSRLCFKGGFIAYDFKIEIHTSFVFSQFSIGSKSDFTSSIKYGLLILFTPQTEALHLYKSSSIFFFNNSFEEEMLLTL
jgi:hypothetical protein